MEKKKIQLIDLRNLDYQSAWDFQEMLFKMLIDRKANKDVPSDVPAHQAGFLLLVEHPNVYTLGKSGDEGHLLADQNFLQQTGTTFFHINRGGDITYHGPGQLVAYPILDLDYFFSDIHKYMRFLEESVILTLAHYGISAGREEKLTGVWVKTEQMLKAEKVCAMGVRTSRWVTMHGLALNVNTDLSFFNRIVPCGIVDKGVTSMQKLLGNALDFEDVKRVFSEKFAEIFECTYLDPNEAVSAELINRAISNPTE